MYGIAKYRASALSFAQVLAPPLFEHIDNKVEVDRRFLLLPDDVRSRVQTQQSAFQSHLGWFLNHCTTNEADLKECPKRHTLPLLR